MGKASSYCNYMHNRKMNRIILSYHQFTEEENDYRFSRTYEQFWHDIRKKVYDEIHIDDARTDMIQACEMMREINVRAKIFVCTGLIGESGFCTWEQLRDISEFHDIENHSSVHVDHSQLDQETQYEYIKDAQDEITEQIGKAPRYFVSPYNNYNLYTDRITNELGLIFVKGRENMLNFSK